MNDKPIAVLAGLVLSLSGAAFGGDPAAPSGDAISDKSTTSASRGADQKHLQREAQRLGVSELDELEDREIVNSMGEVIGEVDRMAVDSSSGNPVIVVGVDGAFGLNMKEVSVPLDKVTMLGNNRLQTSLSKAELQRKRDIDPWDGAYTQAIR